MKCPATVTIIIIRKMILRGLTRHFCQHQPARLQLSLAILKPDLVQHPPHHRQVQEMILEQDFLVVRSKTLNLSRARQLSMSVSLRKVKYFILIGKHVRY